MCLLLQAKLMAMPLERVYFDTTCGNILFAMATGTTISWSLGWLHRPVFSLSFLNVYALDTDTDIAVNNY